MCKLAIDEKTLISVGSLARRLKTTEENIVKMAVLSLEDDVEQKDNLLELAGIVEGEAPKSSVYFQ